MTNITTTSSDNDMVPNTNLTWADAAAMHKDYLRDQRCNGNRRRRNSRRSRTNRPVNRDGFHVLASDGSIDKQATRERRLFGTGGRHTTIVAAPQVELNSDWDGSYSFHPDGSIDKRATRERRIFGEPESYLASLLS